MSRLLLHATRGRCYVEHNVPQGIACSVPVVFRQVVLRYIQVWSAHARIIQILLHTIYLCLHSRAAAACYERAPLC